METKHITLKTNDSLIRFASITKDTEENITNKVISALLKYELLYDIPEECGLNLKYVLDQNDVVLDAFCMLAFRKSSDTYRSHVRCFQIWGFYDCPDCGSELEEDENGKFCINKESCEYDDRIDKETLQLINVDTDICLN